MTEESTLFSLQGDSQSKHKFSLRRSHLEIRMDILTCVQAGAEKPTQIMYKANLSWTALKDHLTALEASKLLNIVEYGNRKRYELTDKAVAVLMAYRKVLEDIAAPSESNVSAF